MIQLTASDLETYWNLVREALRIAGAPTELADSLLLEMDSLTEPQQELFYHADPLHVAGDLSGVKRWSDEQLDAYAAAIHTRSVSLEH